MAQAETADADPVVLHRLEERRKRLDRHDAIASLYIAGEFVPMDVVHLIVGFVGADRPLTVELRDGYLIQEVRNTGAYPRNINYYTAQWLTPTEESNAEWASIRLVKSAEDSDCYHAARYARECRPDLPGGAHHSEPIRTLPESTNESFVLYFVKEQSTWKYTGRGVTLGFPVESRLFFPHSGTQYEYKQAGRTIYGQLVYGIDFTWTSKVKAYRKTIAEVERRRRRSATMASRLATTLGILFGVGTHVT